MVVIIVKTNVQMEFFYMKSVKKGSLKYIMLAKNNNKNKIAIGLQIAQMTRNITRIRFIARPYA